MKVFSFFPSLKQPSYRLDLNFAFFLCGDSSMLPLLQSCGYGVRLWQYPCDEENLQQTVTSVEWRPLIRIEGRQVISLFGKNHVEFFLPEKFFWFQRLMWYVLGKLKTFEDMCGRQHFTLMKKQVYRKHGKKRYLLCKPWGTATCPPRTNLNGSEPVL